MRITLLLVLLTALANSWSAVADEPDPDLDQAIANQLLEELDDAFEEKLPEPRSAEPNDPPAVQDKHQPEIDGVDDGVDEALRRQLGDDLGEASDGDPLERIGRRMRTVKQRLDGNDTSAETQKVQKRIVDDLNALIAQARQRRQQSSQAGGSSSSSRRSRVQQPQQSGRQASAGSNRPATDSSSRLGRADAQVEMAEMQTLLKDLWGHLPKRAREQMLQTSVDEFLPKYELMIEQYFRRLAEENPPP